jgi:prevent-host-death family protein
MKLINIHNAKTHLSKLIQRALLGEEIIIGKAGKPAAKLTAYDLVSEPRKPGLLKGKIKINKDFDRLPASLMKHFRSPNL